MRQRIGDMGLNSEARGPVVVGGVGGSGTRLVARILELFGFFLGTDLNRAHDNLWFTMLLKRPRWFYRRRTDKRSIRHGLDVLEKLMLGKTLTAWDLAFIGRAFLSMTLFGHNADGDGKGAWAVERLKNMLHRKTPCGKEYTGWGWKEPNSHLVLDVLGQKYDDFKYIHLMRHGLDMAFSANQQQLFNWGPIFGVARPVSGEGVPEASLRYWLRANERALKIGKRLGSRKFLPVSFENLCRSPEKEIHRMVRFLDIAVEPARYAEAVALPVPPPSLGRHKREDLGRFGKDDLETLQRLDRKREELAHPEMRNV